MSIKPRNDLLLKEPGSTRVYGGGTATGSKEANRNHRLLTSRVILASLLNTWLPGWHSGKESTCRRRKHKKWRSPGGGNGSPLQYSCLENPMDRGAWWATVHGAEKSQTWLSMRRCTILGSADTKRVYKPAPCSTQVKSHFPNPGNLNAFGSFSIIKAINCIFFWPGAKWPSFSFFFFILRCQHLFLLCLWGFSLEKAPFIQILFD